MDQIWWGLPGPGAFVEKIVRELRNGRQIIAQLPKPSGEGILRAVRTAFGEEGFWTTLDFSEIEFDHSPLEALFDRFARDVPPESTFKTRFLLEQPSFQGRFIAVINLSEKQLPHFLRFLDGYATEIKSIHFLQQTFFLILLEEAFSGHQLRDSPTIAVLPWDGAVDQLDAYLFAGYLCHHHRLSPVLKHLQVSVAANLALWDRQLAEMLCNLPLEELLNPNELLSGIGRERNWNSPIPLEKHWDQGISNSFGGRPLIHSAFLALDPARAKEIERRIWSGQITSLFPFLEEKRQELLQKFEGSLTVPFTTGTGEVIEDKLDLELNHIYGLLCQTPHIDKSDRDHIRELKTLRNDLAHLKIIPAQKLRRVFSK